MILDGDVLLVIAGDSVKIIGRLDTYMKDHMTLAHTTRGFTNLKGTMARAPWSFSMMRKTMFKQIHRTKVAITKPLFHGLVWPPH